MVTVAAMIAVVLNKGKNFPPAIVAPEPYISKNKDMHDVLVQEDVSPFYKGWLGATIQEIDPALAEAFGVDITEGVIVTEALGNSPAESAGLRSGDIIVEFDGTKLRHANHLNFMVEQTGAGKHVAMRIIRDRKEMELNVILGERPTVLYSATSPETIPPEKNIGIMVQNVSENENGGEGVLVIDVQPESAAAKYNIEKGDIITEINRNKISNVAEFIRALISADADEKILLHIKKSDISLYLTIDPAE
jgi:serine protease Do